MNPVQLIITICFFIISLVASLLLGMTSRKFRNESIRLPLAIHGITAFFAIVFYFIFYGHPIGEYLLLFTICSGVILSGWAIRNTYPVLPVRIYLISYLLTVLLFLWSPSLLFYTISGNYRLYRPEQQFNLKSNYFLVEQQSMMTNGDMPVRYKVIRKFGIYNKTLARDLDFGGRLKDAGLVQLNDDTVIVDGVFPDKQHHMIGFRPGMVKNQITRKPG